MEKSKQPFPTKEEPPVVPNHTEKIDPLSDALERSFGGRTAKVQPNDGQFRATRR